jgi:catechol 2,3-dioxygenase-like lactoylglutathione lyase family enzyme
MLVATWTTELVSAITFGSGTIKDHTSMDENHTTSRAASWSMARIELDPWRNASTGVNYLFGHRPLTNMPGIVFLSTERLQEIIEFYTSRLGMRVWLEQTDCTILQYDNLYLGFCQREKADTEGVITLWYETNREVDQRYETLTDLAEGPPAENTKYRIYHFFFRDPEGRRLEVQRFLDR